MMAHARTATNGRNRQMHMAATTRRWTRADLARLPDDGNIYEIIDGELLVTPAPRPAHEMIVEELGHALDEYCRRTGIGRASHSRPAMVTPDSEVEPDIVVRERMVPPPERWDDAPLPMLVVEVLSESSRRNDLIKKRRFYLDSGVPEYWIVDGESRSVGVVTPAGDRTEAHSLLWRPRDGIAPLELDLVRLFEESLGRRTNE